MRKNEDKLIHKIGRGVVTGVMTTSLVLTGTPALLAATQTVALAEGDDTGQKEDTPTPTTGDSDAKKEEKQPETGEQTDEGKQGDEQTQEEVKASDLVDKDGKLVSDKYSAQIITVSTADELSTIAKLVNAGTDFQGKTVKLTADLDLQGAVITPIGTKYFAQSAVPENVTEAGFAGTFDGQKHTISNYKIDTSQDKLDTPLGAAKGLDGKSSGDYTHNLKNQVSSKGLFGYVKGGTIKNLKVSGANVEGLNAEGAVVGVLEGGSVTDVSVDSSTIAGKGENAGGLIGRTSGKVTVTGNSISGSKVLLPSDNEWENGAGGLVGRTQADDGSIITGNTVSGTTVTAYRKAAGLVGYILQPKSTEVDSNKVSGVSITVNPEAKNKSGLPYDGVYVAEVQLANPSNRGYEAYGPDGSVTGFNWVDKDGKKIDEPTTSPVSGFGVDSKNAAENVSFRKDLSLASIDGVEDQQYVKGQPAGLAGLKIDGESPSDGYTVTYKDNDKIGTATVTITADPGKTPYQGSVSKTFDITDKAGLEKLGTAVQNSRTIDSQIDKRRFSAGTVKAYEDAIASAERVRSNKFSSQDEIQKALDDLNDAYGKLTPAQGVSMYRLYNPNSGEHFYTGSKAEHDHLVDVGWSDEGTGWVAPASSNTPVYRLYNPNAGDHHYTTDASERDTLIEAGWNYEGIGWFSDDAREVPLYRQYNPNAQAGSHNFTTSQDENDHLVSLGWRAEGIGWYGIKADAAK